MIMRYVSLTTTTLQQDTHITGNLPALLAAKKRDVFMVQLVTRSLSLVPFQFVVFLRTHKVGTMFTKRLIQCVIYNQQKKFIKITSLMFLATSLLWASCGVSSEPM